MEGHGVVVFQKEKEWGGGGVEKTKTKKTRKRKRKRKRQQPEPTSFIRVWTFITNNSMEVGGGVACPPAL